MFTFFATWYIVYIWIKWINLRMPDVILFSHAWTYCVTDQIYINVYSCDTGSLFIRLACPLLFNITISHFIQLVFFSPCTVKFFTSHLWLRAPSERQLLHFLCVSLYFSVAAFLHRTILSGDGAVSSIVPSLVQKFFAFCKIKLPPISVSSPLLSLFSMS